MWNDKIDNVFGNIVIKKGSDIIEDINTETVFVEPWGSRVMTLYSPAENYADGIYNAELNLKYADKSISGSVTLKGDKYLQNENLPTIFGRQVFEI